MKNLMGAKTLSITQAAAKGVSGVVGLVEKGQALILERHGRPVATVLSIAKAAELEEYEQDLRSLALVLVRAATDNGERFTLNQAMELVGVTQSEIDAISWDHPDLDTDLENE